MDGQQLLALLKSRRSVRKFTPEPIAHDVLERLLEAATTAPSATNRQPWKLTVVTSSSTIESIADVVQAKIGAIDDIAQRGAPSSEMTAYWRYFYEPLRASAALVIPQYRVLSDLLADLIEGGGGNPKDFVTAAAMQSELSATSAATMLLLLQAQAEGLGACWMTGPLVAREELRALLHLEQQWIPMAIVALGHPAENPTCKGRKPLDQVTEWIE
jgi:nitroreductase